MTQIQENKLPEGWIETTLGEVCEIKYGKDHKYLENGNIPCFGSGGFMRNVNQFLYDKPSVLIPRKGTISNLFFVEKPFWTVDTLFYTKINENKILPKFLFYKLKIEKLEDLNVGSAVPSLTTEVLNRFLLSLPPLPEQQAIAKILSSFDDKIELLREQNETLEKIGQEIFKEWFGKYKVGDELPEGWKVGKLGDFAKLKSGFAFKNEDFIDSNTKKALKIKDLKGNGKIDLVDVSSISSEITELDRVKYFKLKAGDIVLAMSGNTTGKIGVVPESDYELFLNQRVGKFFVDDEKFNSFLYFFLMSGNYEEIILNMGYGSAQPNINPGQIENIDLIIPDNNKLKEFLEKSDNLFKKVLKNNTQIQTLSKTRDELLPKLMKGEVRVV